MNTEQERCPFCGSADGVCEVYGRKDAICPWHIECDNCCARGPLAATVELAWELWNRRDEQVEVVTPTRHLTLGEQQIFHDALRDSVAIVSPPAVAAGGVTEAMVTRAMDRAGWTTKPTPPEYETCNGALIDPGLSQDEADHINAQLREEMREILTAALAVGDEGIWEAPDACPVCAVTFKPDDMCQTDIEMGTCHAACLEGSPLADLETGEPMPEGSEWPAPYRYDSLIPTPPSRGEGV